MKKAFTALFVLALTTCFAQNRLFNTHITTTTLFSTPVKTTSVLFTPPETKPLPNYSFNYTLPKGAIFCRMEDALHSRFNLWIKFRMGDDDRYSN